MFKFLKRIFNSGSQVQISGNNSTQIQVSGNGDNTIRIGNFNFGNSIHQVNGTTYINGSVVATGGSVVNCNNNTISITSSNKKHKKSAISSDAKTFSKVNVNGPFNVTYIKSDKYGVSVDASEEMLENITIYVKDDTLIIEPYKSFISENARINIKVQAPYITSVLVSGASDMSINDDLECLSEHICLSLTGAGNIRFKNINCKTASISISGAGDIIGNNLDATSDVHLSVSGAGNIRFKNELHSKTVIYADLVGVGNITARRCYGITRQSCVGAGNISL